MTTSLDHDCQNGSDWNRGEYSGGGFDDHHADGKYQKKSAYEFDGVFFHLLSLLDFLFHLNVVISLQDELCSSEHIQCAVY